MGSYTTQLDVPADRVVPLPDALDSARAAVLPLDLVTAALALELADPPRGGTLFVQGIPGSVGSFVTQQAIANGLQVVGTASEDAFRELYGIFHLASGGPAALTQNVTVTRSDLIKYGN